MNEATKTFREVADSINPNIVYFQYMNHRGEVSIRKVTPIGFEYLPKPGFGYKPGWFLRCYDHDKFAERSFSPDRIVLSDSHLDKGFKLTFEAMEATL